jgi:Protein of unknown function (DUF4054)
MIANDYIAARAPQYATSSRLATLIQMAYDQTGDEFGDSYELAAALRVCHWMARDEMRGGVEGASSGAGNAGFTSSERVGELAKAYSIDKDAQERFGDLSTTVWGLELIELMKSSIITGRTW